MTHYVKWLESDHSARSKRYYSGKFHDWMYRHGIAAMKLACWADLCESKISQQ